MNTIIILLDDIYFKGIGTDRVSALKDAVEIMKALGHIDSVKDFVDIKNDCEIFELGEPLMVTYEYPEPIIYIL